MRRKKRYAHSCKMHILCFLFLVILVAGQMFGTVKVLASLDNPPSIRELSGNWSGTITSDWYVDGQDGVGSQGPFDIFIEVDSESTGKVLFLDTIAPMTYNDGRIEFEYSAEGTWYGGISVTLNGVFSGLVKAEGDRLIIDGEKYYTFDFGHVEGSWKVEKAGTGGTIPILPGTDPPGGDADTLYIVIPGLGGLGSLPGPGSLPQAVAGILLPGLLTIILGALGGAGGSAPSLTAPPSPTGPGGGGQTYSFSDGREYREGHSYTFDDGREYQVTGGEFVPVRELQEGDLYTDADGNRKVWIGGQAWHEADWQRQAATSEGYKQAHAAAWDRESTTLNPDLVASWQRYEQEKAVIDAEIGKLNEKQKQREFIERLHQKYGTESDLELEKLLKQNQQRDTSSARRWSLLDKTLLVGEVGAHVTRFAADVAMDAGAVIIPGGKYVKAGYKMATGAIDKGYTGGFQVDVYKALRGGAGGTVEALKDFVPKSWGKLAGKGAKFGLNVASKVVGGDGFMSGIIKGGVDFGAGELMRYLTPHDPDQFKKLAEFVYWRDFSELSYVCFCPVEHLPYLTEDTFRLFGGQYRYDLTKNLIKKGGELLFSPSKS